jgi:hypothetical protein
MAEFILTSLPELFTGIKSIIDNLKSPPQTQEHQLKHVKKRLPRVGLQQRLARGLAAARHHKAGRGNGSSQNYRM